MSINVGDTVPYGIHELKVVEVYADEEGVKHIMAVPADDPAAEPQKYEGHDLTDIYISIAARRAAQNRKN